MRQDLVLLPGLACDARLYAPQTAALADLAVPLVPNLDAASVGEMADAVLGAAPKRFALAGLSMGGYVAMEILRRAPSRVTRLALISTTARPDAPEQTAMRRELIELARGDRFALVMPRLLPKLISAGRRDDAELRKLVVDMADAVGAETFARQQTAILSRPDSRDDLGRVTVPTVIVCGDADELTPPDRHREMAALIGGATLTVIPGSGHLATLEAPDAVGAALRAWLTA
ncbi:Predicted hydrolase or acyltransferase [uncultured Alphaproteobacteria bacterium]|uniref:Predicted hydrolase or acyltransferase n=1 Tax=uncultured Alphaproteobacteria bacterium TaxID=91750 RepID=A0A212JH91_9PROT|nr:Predicted hydrolase or acyltransferase [uncultured Alphaproteobacteria bacterium]